MERLCLRSFSLHWLQRLRSVRDLRGPQKDGDGSGEYGPIDCYLLKM